MAKTYNNLYPDIYSFESLHAAYMLARRGKRDRREVQKFEQDLEGNLIQLQNELIWGMYQTGHYRQFIVNEPKERLVAALPFRDRVLQHSLVSVIEPIWERRFIFDSYACRPGKGTHKGADRAEAMLRKVKREHGHVYVLKADISKFFYSIDHGVMKSLVRRRIRCRRTLKLIDGIIDSTAMPGDPHPVGLPIGNLTSQLFANVYLNELDEFVKHVLREKNYLRYMDDFLIVHHDKAHLHRIRAQIERFLWERLRLKTNAKTQVFPVGERFGRAVDFLGYRIWTTHRRIRKSSISRITRTLKRLRRQYAAGKIDLSKIRESVMSWIAHASHAETYGLRRKLLASIPFTRGGGPAPMSDAHLVLMTKLEELDAYTHTVLHQFPKLERHLLCAEMRGTMNRVIRQVVVAWKRRQKSAALFDLDVEIEVFRGLIRKAHRLGYINTHRLEVWMRHTNEIGRMVGAWIKNEGGKAM